MPLTIDRETNMARVTNNSSRNRQAAYRERMKAEGLIQVSGWINPEQAADLIELMNALRHRPDLTTGPLRNPSTGRLVSIRTALEDAEE
jgi:hypothetical protein